MGTFALRDLVAADAGWIAEACTDPEILRWTLVPRPYTPAHAEQFVIDRAGELCVWVIDDGAPGRGAGVISIHRVDEATRTAEIGYWVAPWARRRGAATAALRELVLRATSAGTATAFSALIAETNTASRRVAESAGFSLAAVDDNAGTCPDGDCRVTALRYVMNVRG